MGFDGFFPDAFGHGWCSNRTGLNRSRAARSISFGSTASLDESLDGPKDHHLVDSMHFDDLENLT